MVPMKVITYVGRQEDGTYVLNKSLQIAQEGVLATEETNFVQETDMGEVATKMVNDSCEAGFLDQ